MSGASISRLFRAPGLLLAAAGSFACAPAASMNAAAGGPTDAQIVSIALALNQGEVATNEPATEKATTDQVRQFAQRMVTDHTAAVEQLRALDIAPAEHPMALQLTQSATETATVLAEYEGAAFDRAHMDSQVELHQHGLDTIDNFLLPSVRNAQLRALLEQNRTVVMAHLEQARQIRGALPAQ